MAVLLEGVAESLPGNILEAMTVRTEGATVRRYNSRHLMT